MDVDNTGASRHCESPMRWFFACGTILLATLSLPAQDYQPDWIPVGSVPEPLVRRAVEARARLESGSIPLQRSALRLIEADIERFGVAEVRIATVPLVADLVSYEYRVLRMPRGSSVPSDLRVDAVSLLGRLGGVEADRQLRESIRLDPDGAVRARAAQVLASRPGADPESDYETISRALLAAVRRGDGEAEVARLMTSAATAARRVWSADNPDLLLALVLIYEGPYSSSTRASAFAILEELADR